MSLRAASGAVDDRGAAGPSTSRIRFCLPSDWSTHTYGVRNALVQGEFRGILRPWRTVFGHGDRVDDRGVAGTDLNLFDERPDEGAGLRHTEILDNRTHVLYSAPYQSNGGGEDDADRLRAHHASQGKG